MICLPPVGVSCNIFPWICWSLWTSRNKLLFENYRSTPTNITYKGIGLAREWCLAQTPLIKATYQGAAIKSTHNHSPSDLWSSCNTDASWDKKSKRAGLAWIFSDPIRGIHLKGSQVQNYVGSPLIAEILAIKEGLQAALIHQNTKISLL